MIRDIMEHHIIYARVTVHSWKPMLRLLLRAAPAEDQPH
jgi:hypothetical protein